MERGATLALETVQAWRTLIFLKIIRSIAIGDIDGDTKAEIVTGDIYVAGTLSGNVAQLYVWG